MYVGILFLSPTCSNFQKKCQRYWPFAEENEMLVNTFSIQLFSERTYASFEIHHLKLINKKVKKKIIQKRFIFNKCRKNILSYFANYLDIKKKFLI